MKKAIWAILACLLIDRTALAAESYQASPSLITPGGLNIFYNVQGPLSYESLSHRELPSFAVDAGPVSGQSCQYALAVPLGSPTSGSSSSVSGAVGNGGSEKAIASIRRAHPEIRGVYDVIADIHFISVLGIFSKHCTEISARGYK